jgi:hypothetical protein
MNLKNFGNNDAAILLLVLSRKPLIASAAVAASPTARVATARVARTAGVMRDGGMAGSGMMASAVAAVIIAAVRSAAVARSPRTAPATLDLRHQQADQRRSADRDYQCRQRPPHGFLLLPGDGLHAAESPLVADIGRQIWRPRSLIIQVKYETFAATERYICCPAQSER